MRLDAVRIGAPDLEAGTAAYRVLLGVTPAPLADGARRFQLARGAVELAGGEAGVRAIRFVPEAGDAEWALVREQLHGLEVLYGEALPATGEQVAGAEGVEAIDHVVVQTPDPERALALWRDRLGLRLALDRPFPERGLRLTFFRSGGITLEFASPHPAPAERDADDGFHGVSYRVRDLAACRARLLAAGLDVSEVRRGMRPGTSVATVRSGTGGVPTLLLELHATAS
jgi:catechol 2,3-dioxygenase-like lactoylglutathione lyase family enzyme